MRRLSDTPRVYAADGFVTPSEADHVLACAFDGDWLAARNLRPRHGSTGYSFEMPVPGDPVLARLTRRLTEITGLKNRQGATMRFRRYAPGEAHGGHTDSYEIDGATLVATALICLTDVAGGGETVFPHATPAPLAVTPKRRRLVFWYNHRPDGAPDPRSWHEGSPVTAGEKATLTSFIYM